MSKEDASPSAEKKEEDTAVTADIKLDQGRLLDAAKFLIQDADNCSISFEGELCLKGLKGDTYIIYCEELDEDGACSIHILFCGREDKINIFFYGQEAMELRRDIEKKFVEHEVEKKNGLELIALAEKRKSHKEVNEKKDEHKKKCDEIDKELGLTKEDDGIPIQQVTKWLLQSGLSSSS